MSFRSNAMKETYETVVVFGQIMLFSCARIERSTVPEGMYMYEVRHDGDGSPCQIAEWIWADHLGTLITDRPVRLKKSPAISNAYRDVDPENDWRYAGTICSLREFMEEHPPKKEKQKER